MTADVNYFTCTLGQAARSNAGNPRTFATINALIDIQAKRIPNKPAVAFHQPWKDKSDRPGSASETSSELAEVFTFEDLCIGSKTLASHLSAGELAPYLKPKQTIALLAQSTPTFLFTWLALMRVGASVLLIAPQCQPDAIAHLCRTCEAEALIYDPTYAKLAKDASNEGTLRISEISSDWTNVRSKPITEPETAKDWPDVHELDVAYLHHTSGTSSGLPKPIPQTHRAACGVLPKLDGSLIATFTTTPLYHGGIADCFRSWTSGALIWLFPGSIPITSSNILISLRLAEKLHHESDLPWVKYFSSVPYVLQMLAAEPDGLSCLQNMDIVGVGGAALPEEAGNDLVDKGVNLISRFGSAECGFLLSSYRDFATDKAWQYLRPDSSVSLLRFESRDDGLSELVVLKDWPHLAKRNREDGSYATADLFAPHPTIKDAWKYHSRADSQLTLITGKKFDPAPLEDSIAANSLLTDVLIFGNGQQYPGALLWRADQTADMSAEQVLGAVWPDVEKANNGTQSHARISKSMIVVLPHDTERPAKSSKGTLLRKPAEQKHQKTIEEAYARSDEVNDLVSPNEVSNHEMKAFLQSIFRKVTGRDEDIPDDADFFGQGVDSVACMQIRSVLEKQFKAENTGFLPINVIYDCGTITKLVEFLKLFRKGETVTEEDEQGLMKQLVDRYGSFHDVASVSNSSESTDKSSTGRVFLLTGATGALGAHILAQLLDCTDVSQVFCLVRGADEHSCVQRVSKALDYRKLAPNAFDENRVACIPAKLGETRLGLSQSVYSKIANDVDVIIHAAWAVNFSTRLHSFEQDHIRGVNNLISLILAAPENRRTPHFIFCSSTASVISSSSKQGGISEEISNNTSDASPLGYSRSKWVAEAICSRAATHPRLRGHVSVARVGQLCGDTQHGIWNMSEAWPLMLSASRQLRAIPDLGPEPLRWLPVDVAAEALLTIAEKHAHQSQEADGAEVFHVLRQFQGPEPTWNDLIQWVKGEMGQDSIWVVTLSDWVDKLQALEEDHSAKKLLGLWRARAEGGMSGKFDLETDAIWFEQNKTLKTCSNLNAKGFMDREMFGELWRWINPGIGQ